MLAIVVLGAGAAFAASPELRQAVLSGETSVSSVPTVAAPSKPADVSKLLAANLETYDISVRIDKISESSDAYLVDYSYNTYDIVSGAWQETRKQRRIEAFKAMLGKRTLAEYLSDQIGQVTHQELAYLGEVQAAAGKSDTATPAKYAGLVGKDLKTGNGKPSYAGSDIISTAGDGSSGDTTEKQPATAVPGISDKELRDMIVKAVADFLAIDTSMPADTTETSAVTAGETESSAISDSVASDESSPAVSDAQPAADSDSASDEEAVSQQP